MDILNCGGDWTLTDLTDSTSYAAQVPGCVHTDLLAAGAIPDPWFRDNEKELHWVCLRDWSYTREIDVPAEMLCRDAVILRCEGLDTFAEIKVNGTSVLTADNMFRTWVIDIKSHLKAGVNKLEVIFTSPIPYMREKAEKLTIPCWNVYHKDFEGKSYVRKMACSFGWDWGLMAPTAGIWRDMQIHAFNGRIADLCVKQIHTPGSVELPITVEVEGAADEVAVTLQIDGQIVTEQTLPVEGSAACGSLTVENPQLWWTNQMGEQPLYTLTATLKQGGAIEDTESKQLGLRKLELIREPDRYGESFRFRLNGRDTFIKGSNWIPCDIFPSRIEDKTYTNLLESAAESGMNMIRLWGGGIYEEEVFYDECDRLGLLIWHDFMFACSGYPGYDDAFVANVRQEAIDNVKRIRHRASLGLWCGNNEIEQGLVKWTDDGWDTAMPCGDYIRIFDEVLPEVVAEHDGITPYWPSSGHTPGSNRQDSRDCRKGDAHSWSVWFGGQALEEQRNWVFRFMSEFGFQSFPELKTIETFTNPDERSVTGWIMDFHQRSQMGNATIFKYMLDWFCQPKDFESSLWLTQLIQALTVQYAADHARRIQGRMDGLLYWQINDIWPGATWSSIDVFGRWKALQFFAKRFFEPTHLSIQEEPQLSTMALNISNQTPTDNTYTLAYQIMTFGGEILEEKSQDVTVASQSNMLVETLECTALRHHGGATRQPTGFHPHREWTYKTIYEGDRDLLVFGRVLLDGVEVSRNLATFARPKLLDLRDPQIGISLSATGQGKTTATLSTDVPAPWVRLDGGDLEPKFMDNFFHLVPGIPHTVEVRSDATLEALQSAIKAVPLSAYWR